ncbi:hypothetical protein RPD76_07635 [Methylomonas sp. MV1]|uniref:hypothetical protein n=1 Tax=Methylomonas sp. MV1 TaxID=3073620 RepID=UPI0028A50BAA|nr:hypothetical protein [Methylomonas sp. MV1]MDT4329777.1 hypothetical protein [Methylomonas sp. MV1]
MSTFIITIEDNAKGVYIKAHDIRQSEDDRAAAYGMGCFLIDTLNKYLVAHGIEEIAVASNQSNTRH